MKQFSSGKWFHDRRSSFVSSFFIDSQKCRFKKVTSNAAENINSAHVDNRSKPILDMVFSIQTWIVALFNKNDEQGLLWEREGCLLTKMQNT